jgi:hypothetical protein
VYDDSDAAWVLLTDVRSECVSKEVKIGIYGNILEGYAALPALRKSVIGIILIYEYVTVSE